MYSQAGESYLGGRYCIQSTSAIRRISMIQRPQSKRLFLPVSAMGNDMENDLRSILTAVLRYHDKK